MFSADHPSFSDQPHSDAVVWRYMDLARYLSMLQTSSLHFARADQMNDRWEGTAGAATIATRPSRYGATLATNPGWFGFKRTALLKITYMNCWHESEVESAAMWDIYQGRGLGVAIRSTWGALTSSLSTSREIYGGRVHYVDYATTVIAEDNAFDAFLCKRESFAHEKEVRLLHLLDGGEGEYMDDDNDLTGPKVLPFEVTLSGLVERVMVAPEAPHWFLDVVSDVTDRYGFSFPVGQSDLASDPVD